MVWAEFENVSESVREEDVYDEDISGTVISEVVSSVCVYDVCSGSFGADDGFDTAGEVAFLGMVTVAACVVLVLVTVLVVVSVVSSTSVGASDTAEHSEADCCTTMVTVVVKVDLPNPG